MSQRATAAEGGEAETKQFAVSGDVERKQRPHCLNKVGKWYLRTTNREIEHRSEQR